MIQDVLNYLALVKNTVEAVLAKFPTSAPMLAAFAAWALSRFGLHATVGTIEVVVGAVAVIIAALTAHSVKKAKRAAASK